MFLKVRNYSLNPLGLLKVYSNKMKMKYISVAYFTICNECDNIFFSHFFLLYYNCRRLLFTLALVCISILTTLKYPYRLKLILIMRNLNIA